MYWHLDLHQQGQTLLIHIITLDGFSPVHRTKACGAAGYQSRDPSWRDKRQKGRRRRKMGKWMNDPTGRHKVCPIHHSQGRGIRKLFLFDLFHTHACTHVFTANKLCVIMLSSLSVRCLCAPPSFLHLPSPHKSSSCVL